MAQESSSVSAAYDTRVIARRVVATIVDYFVLSLMFGALSLPFGSARGIGEVLKLSFSSATDTFISLFFFAALLAYYIVLEGLYGQTLGKMLVGVRVVLEDTGGHPGIRAATLRTAMRIVDSIGNYLLAFIVALLSDKDRRVGDMVAKTLVIRNSL